MTKEEKAECSEGLPSQSDQMDRRILQKRRYGITSITGNYERRRTKAVMKILERLLEIYYRYDMMFLNLALIILTVGLEYGIKSVEDEEEKVGQQILKGIFYSITAICVGYILYVSGMLPEIEYPYFNGMIFLLAEGLVICYGTLNSIFYRKSWEPLVQASRNTGFVVVFELFLLAATGQL